MRVLAAAMVIGPLLLIGGLPASAAQPTLAPDSSAPVRLAAGGDGAANRDSYARKAQDDIQDWQRRLHDFGATAAAKGQEAGKVAEDEMNKAWIVADAEARKLQTASAEGWETARVSFEKASRELANAWDKYRPKDK